MIVRQTNVAAQRDAEVKSRIQNQKINARQPPSVFPLANHLAAA
jgi:hypothetical protein